MFQTLSSRIFLAFFLLIIVVVSASAWFFTTSMKEFYYEEKVNDLTSRAILFSESLSGSNLHDINALTKLCQRLGQNTQTRFTIIDESGKVLGDSQHNPAEMDNHINRPEIQSAFNDSTGMSIRFSATVQKEMMYLAIPISIQGIQLVIRSSLPITDLQEKITKLYVKLFISVLFITILALAGSFYISKKISSPLMEMEAGAAQFSSGDFSTKLPRFATNELNQLADSLNSMAAELDERIQFITEKKNEQSAILSSMVEAVIALTNAGEIIMLNKAGSALFKLDIEKSIGKSVFGLIRNAEFINYFQQLTSPERFNEQEIYISESSKYLIARGTALLNAEGESIGSVVVFNDITRMRKLENIRKEFVANVSHELKTPITAIKGFVETLLTVENTKDQHKFLKITASHTDRLNQIIDDLLLLSRIEQKEDKQQIDFEVYPLTTIIGDSLATCSHDIKQKQIQIETDIDEKLATPLNPGLIQDALVNLINNAIKYSHTGGRVTLTVEQKNKLISLRISDEGIGIDPAHFDRLFERFYRVDEGRSRNEGGTGLGLAIVKHIVRLHGGTVSVSSKPGNGSTFEICLPA